VYGTEVTTTPTGRDSRRIVPEKLSPPELTYGTVEKRRRLGRVVEILVHLIFVEGLQCRLFEPGRETHSAIQGSDLRDTHLLSIL
jgi:hypothetical protein